MRWHGDTVSLGLEKGALPRHGGTGEPADVVPSGIVRFNSYLTAGTEHASESPKHGGSNASEASLHAQCLIQTGHGIAIV